ncbi:uncharacterized protein LOC131019897 isoform X2 [Salvia miltiorrhiza]|uniref:uncharacterized protein LOC131019897 isoform X2 n=2 Tax=Salvia miltiorrhiza TaxID=226208 RepID=UPI0025ACB807|nr:uncharacterized protein LOC131019897 isoform X2 [Salvia miltiorrhiza]
MGLLLSRLELILEVLGKSKIIVGLLEGIPTMLKGEVAMADHSSDSDQFHHVCSSFSKGLIFQVQSLFLQSRIPTYARRGVQELKRRGVQELKRQVNCRKDSLESRKHTKSMFIILF